jgi:anti-sigma factor ChrR (cupin superfamily)
VLDGVFSDEHGDWPAGTFLLNPEGFRHAPFSNRGCVLFVKLRQFAGRDRRHVVVDTNKVDWQPTAIPGVTCKELYQQDGFADRIRLELWTAGTDLGDVVYEHGAELFVIDGEFADESGSFGSRCWLRFPPGSQHRPKTLSGCTLYIKRGGLAYLSSAVEAAGLPISS